MKAAFLVLLASPLWLLRLGWHLWRTFEDGPGYSDDDEDGLPPDDSHQT